MTHKMHTCKGENTEVILAALRANHGWPHDKIPLNVEYSKRTGTTKHETCPYCGLESSKFEDVPVEDAVSLGVNRRGSAFARAGLQNPKDSGSLAILSELKALRAKVDKMEGKK